MAEFDSMFELSAAGGHADLFGESATLIRNGAETTGVVASWEDREFDIVDDEGGSHWVGLRTWTIALGSYLIDGVAATPREGDLVQVTENGVVITFEIMPEGDEPAVRKHSGGYRWRLTSKKVS